MKILHAPLNLANDTWNLAKAQRDAGHDVHLATIATSPYVELGDMDLTFRNRSMVGRQLGKLRFALLEMPRYDVIHFHTDRSILDYGEGLFSLLDFKAAARRNQVIALTFHGCEVRNLQKGGCPWPCSDPVCLEGNHAERVARMTKVADCIYVTTPDLLPAVPSAHLLPQSIEGLKQLVPHYYVFDASAKKRPRIVHCPSKRSTKGTDTILAAVNALQREGYDFEFRLVEGVPHAQALEELAQADIVIDHVQCGWYGVLSVEAAALGKPVLVRMDEQCLRDSGLGRPPFIAVDKSNVASVLRNTLNHPEQWASMGATNRAFVLERHSAEAHARQTLEEYETALDARRK